MSKKVYNLITGIVTGVEAIVGTAVLAVCKLFVKEA